MRIAVAIAAITLIAAVPASAAMDVNTFLIKVAALKAKGIGALFSSDIGLLKREAGVAVVQIDAEKKARVSAGKPPLFCAPPTERKMSSDAMVAGLSEIAPAQRGMSLKDGFVRVLVKRYPCG